MLSQAAYCGKDEYMSHKFSGVLEGFICTYAIYDPDHDTQGFVGYFPSDNSIYVVLRGTTSITNWESDLNATKSDYNDDHCKDCYVHSGFFNAEQHVIPRIVLEVGRLSNKYGTLRAKTTGHSLGAALANLAAVDLVKAGYEVSMYNFGQPRVGNKAYAAYANAILPEQYRVTHYKDIVPHVPGDAMGFYHTTQEVYEDLGGALTFCSTTDGEDPACSD